MELSHITSRGSTKSPGEKELLGENSREAAQAPTISDAILRVGFRCVYPLATLE